MSTEPASRQGVPEGHPHYLGLDSDPNQLTDLTKSANAACVLEQRKKLTVRMRNYAETLQVKIEATVIEKGTDKEVSELSFIRKAVYWAFKQAVNATAWLLDQIQKLAEWISDVLSTTSRPVTSIYSRVKTWFVGAEAHTAAA